MELIRVHPRDLDMTGPWLFWAASPEPRLAASLETLGQTVPILVDFAPDKPRLVAGCARVMALKEVKGATLLARPVSSVLEEQDHEGDGGALAAFPEDVRFGLLYLASNLERAVDEAMLVAAGRFFAERLPFEQTLRLAGPQLGLGPKERRARDLEAWLSLPSRLDGLLRKGLLTLSSAPDLAALGGGLQAVEPYLWAVRWSRNALRNFLAFLTEAAAARGESVPAVIERAGLPGILALELSPNDLSSRLLAGARAIRYPHLTGIEERFAALSGELRKGTKLSLAPSQGFETDAVRLTADIRNRAGLERLMADLALAAKRPQWEALWSLARDAEDEHDG